MSKFSNFSQTVLIIFIGLFFIFLISFLSAPKLDNVLIIDDKTIQYQTENHISKKGDILNIDKDVNLIKNCIVSNVIDGDTVDLICWNLVINNNRLLWIDSSEIHLNQCMSQEAKLFVEKITKDKKLDILFLWKDDCINNVCRNEIVIYENKENINKQIVENGYAYVWDEYILKKQNKSDLNIYLKAQKSAQSKKIWLWGNCDISENQTKEWRKYIIKNK